MGSGPFICRTDSGPQRLPGPTEGCSEALGSALAAVGCRLSPGFGGFSIHCLPPKVNRRRGERA